MADKPSPALMSLDPEALARAEQALASLSGRYLDWALADLQRLEACMERLITGEGMADRNRELLFGIAHDMKGQGKTFGYDLISQLGNRLCRLIESQPDGLDDMERLVEGMALVLRKELSGDGGPEGQALMIRLSP